MTFKALLFSLLMAIVPSVAFGATYYVSTSGSDSASGSSSSPWRTIQHAADVANPGDTVRVTAGTYAESPYISRGGSSSARIVFMSDTKWGAKVTGDGSSNYTFEVAAGYIDIVDFDVSNKNPSGHQGIETYNTVGHDRVIGNNVHNVWAAGCTDGLGGAGVNLAGSGGYFEAISNRVHDIGDVTRGCGLVHGIYIESHYGVVENNIIYRAMGWGITTWHDNTNSTIMNNTIFNNNVAGIDVDCGDGCPSSGVNDYTLVANNNVFYNGNPINGFIQGGSPQYGISDALGHAGPHNQFYNNIVYGNKPSDIYVIYSTNVAGNITTPPTNIFVNYQPDGSGDYHLKSGSVAIDGGINSSTLTTAFPKTDFDGNPRPQGSAYDVGAYEYGSSAASPTPTPTPTPAPSPSPSPSPSPKPSPSPSPSPSPVSSDTTAPVTSITSPANGSQVARKSTVTIQAQATDNVGVTRVEFYVNGSLMCTDTSMPYSCGWTLPGAPNKTYRLQTKAYDAAGNTGSSAVVTVTSK